MEASTLSQVADTKAELLLRRPVYQHSTGAGFAGIATFILDGAGIGRLLQPFVRSKSTLEALGGGELFFGRIVDASGALIDEAVFAFADSSESETGNEQIEVSCHGGIGVVHAVEAVLQDAGFLLARDTELLERAHLRARLSLIAIEARLRLQSAATARQADFLLGHGEFQKHWERLGFEMTMSMRDQRSTWRQPTLEAADAALKQAATARNLLAQHRVVICGPVNAGKSTLANLLARAERHIVSAQPGTTLDVLETPLSIRGLNVLLSDTAGVRESHDDLEKLGQQRGLHSAHNAALRLILIEGCREPSEAEVDLVRQLASSGPALLVLNKQDLGIDQNATGLGFVTGQDPICISAKTGFGFEKLQRDVEIALLGNDTLDHAPFTLRHIMRLKAMRDGIMEGTAGLEILQHLRKLIGHRPDAAELGIVLAECGAAH